MKRRLPLALAALLFPTVTVAQSGPGTYEFTFDPVLSPFHRAEMGELDGDGLADVIVHAGTRVVLFAGPAALDGRTTLPLAAVDAVTVPESGYDGRRSVLLVNDSGLHELWLEPEPPTFEQDWEVETVATAGWSDVVVMLSAELGGYPETDLLGLDGTNLRTFHVLLRDPADDWLYFPPFLAPNPLPEAEFDVIDTDGNGIQEVACVTSWGLQLVQWDGTVAWEVPNAYAGGRVATFRENGVPRLAWVRTVDPQGSQELVVFDADGTAEPPVALGARGVVSLDAADLDADGDDDLLLTDVTSHEGTLLLCRQGQATTFAYDLYDPLATIVYLYGPAGPHPGNQVDPFFGDLDGDEMADVMMPVQSTGTVHYQSGKWLLPQPLSFDPVSVFGAYEDGSGEWWLSLFYDASGVNPRFDCLVARVTRINGSTGNETNLVNCTVDLEEGVGATIDVALAIGAQDPPTTDPFHYRAWFAPSVYEPPGGPFYDQNDVGPVVPYVYTVTGGCEDWPEGFDLSCESTGYDDIETLPLDGTVVGAFDSAIRIDLIDPHDIWPVVSGCGP